MVRAPISALGFSHLVVGVPMRRVVSSGLSVESAITPYARFVRPVTERSIGPGPGSGTQRTSRGSVPSAENMRRPGVELVKMLALSTAAP